MKNNSRNRKLTYIRAKNAINAGVRHVNANFKISKEMLLPELKESLQAHLDYAAHQAWKSAQRYWRVKWVPEETRVEYGHEGSDIAKNLQTIKLTFYRWKTLEKCNPN